MYSIKRNARFSFQLKSILHIRALSDQAADNVGILCVFILVSLVGVPFANRIGWKSRATRAIFNLQRDVNYN